MARRYDSRTTIFSPEGRLYQVEYAMEAIGNAGAAVGILAKDGVVLAAEKRITSKVRCAQDAPQSELCGALRATSRRAHLSALHFPGQHNAAAVSSLAPATLLHACYMLQCLQCTSRRHEMLPTRASIAGHIGHEGPCGCASIIHAPHCMSVLLQLLDTSAVGVRREKMYKLDDHVACAVAGITGDPLCSSSIWRSGNQHTGLPVCSSSG